jgi:hypothetical protein
MARYRRLPAFLVLASALLLAGFYVRTWGRSSLGGDRIPLSALEAQIASGKATAETWNAYAQRLAEVQRYDDAVLAYRRVMELDPGNHRQARADCAIALARRAAQPGPSRSEKEEEFYDYVRTLIHGDPKFAMDLLDRSEFSAYVGRSRFEVLKKEARAQAMD